MEIESEELIMAYIFNDDNSKVTIDRMFMRPVFTINIEPGAVGTVQFELWWHTDYDHRPTLLGVSEMYIRGNSDEWLDIKGCEVKLHQVNANNKYWSFDVYCKNSSSQRVALSSNSFVDLSCLR